MWWKVDDLRLGPDEYDKLPRYTTHRDVLEKEHSKHSEVRGSGSFVRTHGSLLLLCHPRMDRSTNTVSLFPTLLLKIVSRAPSRTIFAKSHPPGTPPLGHASPPLLRSYASPWRLPCGVHAVSMRCPLRGGDQSIMEARKRDCS